MECIVLIVAGYRQDGGTPTVKMARTITRSEALYFLSVPQNKDLSKTAREGTRRWVQGMLSWDRRYPPTPTLHGDFRTLPIYVNREKNADIRGNEA